MRYNSLRHGPLTLGKKINEGGEGEIYEVSGDPDKVAKIYHPNRLKDIEGEEKEKKLRYMVAHPPPNCEEFIRGRSHYNLTWPLDILLNERGQFCGFLMPKIRGSYPILHLFTLKEREKIYEKTGIQFSYKFLLRVASNLSQVVANLHAANYVIGDINEQNILFNKDALVTILDVDSFQVTAPNGAFWPCPVGKYEYTHPNILKELLASGKSYRDIRRFPAHDVFGMAVIIFRLLMEGWHPFQGVLPTEPARIEEMIEKGIFVYAKAIKSAHQVTPPPASPDYSHIYPDLGRLFNRTFLKGYEDIHKTPSAKLFEIALSYYERSLTQCNANPNHFYYQRPNQESACPFCKYKKRFRKDLFPPHKRVNSSSDRKHPPASSLSSNPSGPLLRIYLVFDLYMAPNNILEEINESISSFFQLLYNDRQVKSQLQISIEGIGGKSITFRELSFITEPIPPLILNTDYQPDLLSSLHATVQRAVNTSREDIRFSRPFYRPWILLYFSSEAVSLPSSLSDEKKIRIQEALQKNWITIMSFRLYESKMEEFFGKKVVAIKPKALRKSFEWLFEVIKMRLSESDPKKPVKLPSMGPWRAT